MTVYAILDSDFEQYGIAYKSERMAREAFLDFLDKRIPSYGLGSWEYYADQMGYDSVDAFKEAFFDWDDYDDEFEDIGQIIAIETED